MDIGSKIKSLRHKCALTQEQLATRLGISTQSVSKWETGVTMPDITLLPSLSGELGVTIDELFDLSVNQRLQRIENRLDTEEEISAAAFEEYVTYLEQQLRENGDKSRILSLLANLYHHRMESDSRRVSRYAREAIMLSPEKKDCQWLLQRAEGAVAWDWNVSNHTEIIEFYKSVIESNNGKEKAASPYYYLIDNLLADHRADEAEKYLDVLATLPAHKPFLIAVYRAHIALARYDEQRAEQIMRDGESAYGDNSGFIFEAAQYYAKKCDWQKAIEYYERSFRMEENEKPRFTDALSAIATVYEILGDYPRSLATHERVISCLKDEWGYSDADAPVLSAEREKKRVADKARRMG